MQELEVRFSITERDNYKKVLNYLQEHYTLTAETHQVDKYFKERGREKEDDVIGSYIYRIRVEEDSKYIFTRKDTVKSGLWNEDEIILTDEEAKFLERVFLSGFSPTLTIKKDRQTFSNNLQTVN